MPTMFDGQINYAVVSKRRGEVQRELIAKGLIPGSRKFSEVMRRKMQRQGFRG